MRQSPSLRICWRRLNTWRSTGSVAALRLDGIRQVVERGRVCRMRLAKDAPMDCERFAKQRFRAGRITRCDQHLSDCSDRRLGGSSLGR